MRGSHLQRSRVPARRAAGGYTLIELMVTVAIVGILMAIAVASYDFATVKTRRSAAQGCLTEGAQYMERYYTLHFSYVGAVLPDCSADVSDFYAVGFSGTPDADSYAIQAVPNARQKDSTCGTLSVDSAGTKGANNVDSCW
jgi:type IV pilus assembly protein PilE